MADDPPFEMTLHRSVAEIPEWDACACPEGAPALDPFTTQRFLRALETSGSVGPGTGWEPRPVALRQEGRLVAVAPLYLKSHSQGEYIFDWSWAEAYERAGGAYYPKLQVAVPFTPVPGRRLLLRPGAPGARAALLQGLAQIAAQNGLSSVHVTFCTEGEAEAAEAAGYLPRLGQQFHWLNAGYRDFEDFLAALSSRKRKAIRRERAQAQAAVEIRALTGAQIEPAHWDALWTFYQDTGARKWGRPYLTRPFFEALHAMRDEVLLVLAFRGGRAVAGALNLIGREALFGRYWGAIEHHPSLHFELCYHQAIEFAIARGLARVEAGAQGEHKLARGYLPAPVHSAHFLVHAGLRRAVGEFLAAERAATGEEIEILTALGPFRRGPRPETGDT